MNAVPVEEDPAVQFLMSAFPEDASELMPHFRRRATSYEARPIRRSRATKAEMEERRGALVALAKEHGPCSVRHLFYRAVVGGVPGITKTDSGYAKVQRLMLELRRDHQVAYELVVDSTRWMRKPNTWDSPDEALRHVAALYRRDLWSDSPFRVEVWAESDSIGSTVMDITESWVVPLFVTRGFSSETFAYNAADNWKQTPDRQPVVLYVGDHDPHGLSIETNLRAKLGMFTEDMFERIDWLRIGVTWEQVEDFNLPGTEPKKPYGYPLAVEAEALPPRFLRTYLDLAIRDHVDESEMQHLEAVEAEERDLLLKIAAREFAA